jgi:hypothetical protein
MVLTLCLSTLAGRWLTPRPHVTRSLIVEDFLAVCLRKSPDDRPEAEDLLKVRCVVLPLSLSWFLVCPVDKLADASLHLSFLQHPFLMNAKDVHVLSFLKVYTRAPFRPIMGLTL